MARPFLQDSWVGEGQVLGNGEDLGVVGDTVREFFARSDVSTEALVVDELLLDFLGLTKEAFADLERFFQCYALDTGEPDLKYSVLAPRFDHFFTQSIVGFATCDFFW